MRRIPLFRLIVYTSVSIFLFTVMWLFRLQAKNQELHERQYSALYKMILDTQSMMSRTGMYINQIEAVIESTKKLDLLKFSSELDEIDTRSAFVPPNIHAVIGNEDCSFSRNVKSNADVQMVDLFTNLSIKNVNTGVWTDGTQLTYKESSYEEKKLEVVLIPHSHNDPGWGKTFQQYFDQDTNSILNNVLKYVEQKPERRFSWVEISFFSLWWEKASVSMRERFKTMVQSGQIEFLTGGWVMEDEANTHLYAMVDQLIEGNDFIKKHLNAEVKSAWSIDPFGLSPTVAYLRKRSGFQNMVIQRTHYFVKKYFASNQLLEFRWRQNWDPDSSTDMLAHMMVFSNAYNFIDTCGPDKMVCCQFDFQRLITGIPTGCKKHGPVETTDANVAERSKMILEQYKKKARIYRSNVVMVAVGGDFEHRNSRQVEVTFNNHEKIFEYINSHPELNTRIRWGTLSEYFDLVRQRMKLEDFPSYSGDFFTYADKDQAYWSGYYTSRAFYKKLDRVLEARLRSAEIAFSMANLFVESSNHAFSIWENEAQGLHEKLTEARRNLGLFQHHDGITGTAKDHVVVDYGNRLLKSVRNADDVIAAASEYLLLASDAQFFSRMSPPNLNSLNAWKVSEKRATHDSMPEGTVLSVKGLADGSVVPVLFYNSLGFQRQQLVSVLVDSPNVQVIGHRGNIVPSQLAPKWSNKALSLNMEADVYELWFTVNMTPLSLSRYFVMAATKSDSKSKIFTMRAKTPVDESFPNNGFEIEHSETKEFKLANYQYVLTFGENGLLKTVQDQSTPSASTRVELSFVSYHVTKGGAYLFYPDKDAVKVPSLGPPVVIEKGPLFSRVIVMLDNVVHTLRLHNSPGLDGHSILISNLVDIRMLSNREMAMRVDAVDLLVDSTAGKVKTSFYTDLNGFQMQARHHHSKLPLQASFYPMPSQMVISSLSGKSRLSLHSAEAHGAGMTSSGYVDIILDRKLMQDDDRGLGQGVKDNKLTPNDFWLVLETFSSQHKQNSAVDSSDYTIHPTLLSQQANLALNNPVVTLVQPGLHVSSDLSDVASPSGFKGQALKFLPCDVHLLSFRTMRVKEKQSLLLLHRIGHSCKIGTWGLVAPTNCALTNGHLSLPDLFSGPANHYTDQGDSGSGRLQFAEYTLNGIHQLSDKSQTVVHIEPMNINTYQVKQVS